MSTDRSAEQQIVDQANRAAQNPNASKQKISDSQATPEFEENHKRFRAERLAREAREKDGSKCRGAPAFF